MNSPFTKLLLTVVLVAQTLPTTLLAVHPDCQQKACTCSTPAEVDCCCSSAVKKSCCKEFTSKHCCADVGIESNVKRCVSKQEIGICHCGCDHSTQQNTAPVDWRSNDELLAKATSSQNSQLIPVHSKAITRPAVENSGFRESSDVQPLLCLWLI